MITIACADDSLGMMFNNRRVSQDREVRNDIKTFVKNAPLWMNAYSASQFENDEINICQDEEFLLKAPKGEYCFVETHSLAQVEEHIETIILYKWNRRYPSDLKFDINLSNWHLEETKDFQGNSHEKITREIYKR